MTTYRLFVAIPLPKQVIQALGKVQKQITDPKLVRWVQPANMHLTLQFIGNFPQDRVDQLVARLEQATAGETAITLAAEGLGVFPNLKRPNVIWIGLSGDIAGLHQLHNAVINATETLAIKPDKRPFKPHLTLGRTKRQMSGKDYAQLSNLIQEHQPVVGQIAKFSAQSVHLMHSELTSAGPSYTTLADLPLQDTIQQTGYASSDKLNNTTK